jgi:hypothetical protein
VALLAVAGAWLLTAAPPALAAEYGSLSGKVTDASTQAPIEGIEACAISVNLELLTEEEFEHGFRCAKTAATGEYTITELQAEKYRVGFFIPETGSLNYVGEYYGGKQLESEATEVAVKAGATTPEINGELSPGAEIAGTVTNAATGAPVAEASVCAFAEPVSGRSNSRPAPNPARRAATRCVDWRAVSTSCSSSPGRSRSPSTTARAPGRKRPSWL